MTIFRYLQKLFFLFVIGCSLNFMYACDDDKENEPFTEETGDNTDKNDEDEDEDDNTTLDDKDDPALNFTDIAVTGLVDVHGCAYADISGYVNLNLLPNGDGYIEVGIEFIKADAEEGVWDKLVITSLTGRVFTANLYGLSPSTEYRYRTYVKYSGLTHYGEYRTFTTKDLINVATTGDAFDITGTFVKVMANIGTADPKDGAIVGIAYSTSASALHPDSTFYSEKSPVQNIEGNTYTVTLNNLSKETLYYYASFTEVGGMIIFSEVKSFTTEYFELFLSGAVDLRTAGRIKWAACNIGASSPEESGGFYAWGETDEKNEYTPLTYKYYQGEWKDVGDSIYTDEFTNIGHDISGTKYDVARVKLGDNWRMPTKTDLESLINRCTWKRGSYNGVNGMYVIGPNNNCIFLPSAGCRYGTEIYNGNDSVFVSYYWTANATSGYTYILYFDNEKNPDYYYNENSFGIVMWRFYGFPVRPVCK